jgi:hypothetical protein
MQLEACFTTADFQNAFAQLTPLAVSLDRDSRHRQLSLQSPWEVGLVAHQGLRVVSEVQLQWDVIGLRVPVTLRRVAILLTPRVDVIDTRQALVFGLRIEEADLSAIPAFLRDAVVGRVNEALAKPDARIVWRFMDTLDFSFPLPSEIQPRYRMRLHALAGAVEVGDDVLRLRVDWGLSPTVDPGVV